MCAKCAQLADEDEEDEEGIRYGGEVGRERHFWYCVSVTEE